MILFVNTNRYEAQNKKIFLLKTALIARAKNLKGNELVMRSTFPFCKYN